MLDVRYQNATETALFKNVRALRDVLCGLLGWLGLWRRGLESISDRETRQMANTRPIPLIGFCQTGWNAKVVRSLASVPESVVPGSYIGTWLVDHRMNNRVLQLPNIKDFCEAHMQSNHSLEHNTRYKYQRKTKYSDLPNDRQRLY